jgi:hypothetical protein
MIDLSIAKENTRNPSTTQLFQNELNKAFRNLGFRFDFLALASSSSHRLEKKAKEN